MKLRIGWVICAYLGVLASSSALEIEGVSLAASKTVSGQTLQLNGAGVRTVTLAFIPIKAYVASFYSPIDLDTHKEVLESPGPLQLNFTFLQGVSDTQVEDAWEAQFKESLGYRYAGLAADQSKFIGYFGSLSKFGTETVEIVGEETRVIENGRLKGTISGKDFQKAFLSLWFGSKPVMPELKTALLGK